MPGPGNKNRRKKTGKGGEVKSLPSHRGEDIATSPIAAAAATIPPTPPSTPKIQCYTLLEDEMTRCGEPATSGRPGERRCKVHHAQYITMCKKYKAASHTVDEIKNSGQFPSSSEILAMKDRSEVLRKLKWLDSYVEAIRVERYGRKIHSGRFFLKMDTGHKTRINILAKEMERANDLRKKLGRQAFALETEPESNLNGPRAAKGQSNSDAGTEYLEAFEQAKKAFVKPGGPLHVRAPELNGSGIVEATIVDSKAPEDEDLIEQGVGLEKHRLLALFEPLLESDGRKTLFEFNGITENTETGAYIHRVGHIALSQYLRRAAYYDSGLYYKTLDKVSFKDWILSPEFTLEDASNLVVHFLGMTGFGLLWLKDAVHEAVEIVRRDDESITANLGQTNNRINILGGWIYREKYTKKVSDEVWWHLYGIADVEPETENRMVRLCNTFDDLTGFLSVAAFRPSVDPPRHPPGKLASSVPRMHLSISGVIIADMISPTLSLGPSIIPTPLPAKRPGHMVWAEIEFRSYMFGAVRHENEPFTENFLTELRARPDLFQFVIWDETTPDATAQEFGSGEGGRALPQVRARKFESPIRSGEPAAGQGPWDTNGLGRSAREVLFAPYGDASKGKITGYITSLRRQDKGWFFRFKSPSIPVRYIVILDTTPNRDVSVLSHHVAWMALRAGGYGTGEFTHKKYHKASDQLFERHARQRLAWQPAFFGGWAVNNMDSDEETENKEAFSQPRENFTRSQGASSP